MCFQVRSYNTAGSSAYTPYACATTPSPPNAPINGWAAPLSNSQIRFTWYDQSHNETGFQVFDGVNYYTMAPNVTGFIRGGLAPRTYMCLQVRSFNNAGYSAWTPWSCATTF